MTDEELDDYIANAGLETSPEFYDRWWELERRRANEPMMTVQQEADFMNLPVDVFRHIQGCLLALGFIMRNMGTPH